MRRCPGSSSRKPWKMRLSTTDQFSTFAESFSITGWPDLSASGSRVAKIAALLTIALSDTVRAIGWPTDKLFIRNDLGLGHGWFWGNFYVLTRLFCAIGMPNSVRNGHFTTTIVGVAEDTVLDRGSNEAIWRVSTQIALLPWRSSQRFRCCHSRPLHTNGLVETAAQRHHAGRRSAARRHLLHQADIVIRDMDVTHSIRRHAKGRSGAAPHSDDATGRSNGIVGHRRPRSRRRARGRHLLPSGTIPNLGVAQKTAVAPSSKQDNLLARGVVSRAPHPQCP